jgi:hypothetical protein
MKQRRDEAFDRHMREMMRGRGGLTWAERFCIVHNLDGIAAAAAGDPPGAGERIRIAIDEFNAWIVEFARSTRRRRSRRRAR